MPSLHAVLQTVIGPAFEIGRELPGAGMSRVFLAREPALGRDVVVKVLPPDLVSSSSLQRFTREVEVTARLQHPHILPIITAGGNDDLRYYITPFIGGESLSARLASGEPMTVTEAVRIGEQLLNAVAFAHARGVIHRDIKPGNILLSDGHAILADFGIAAIAEAQHPTDHGDQVTGSTMDSTRVYVAPEHPRTEQRDLFAAAVVIHEMAAGVPGRAGLTAASITASLRSRHPRAGVAELRKLATVLSRALSMEPGARYQSASELRAAVHAIGRGNRRPMIAGIGVGGAAALLALSTFALRSPTPDNPSLLLQSAPPRTPAASDSARVAPAPGVAPVVATPDPTRPKGVLDSARYLYRRGDLGGAVDLFQRAVAEDTADSRAELGLAITLGILNSPADNEASRVAASRAITGKPALDEHDRAIAEGFVALASQRYPDACAAFERARRSRESFEAWFGAGECRFRDDMIVFDANGAPQFRAGYATAFAAYSNAVRAATPFAPVTVYRRLMMTTPQTNTELRMGRTPDNRVFVAQWRLLGDTLGHVPMATGAPRQVSPAAFEASAEAARVGRQALRPLLVSWVARAPREAAAHEALALLLENMGIISEDGDDRVSALSEMARARALEREPTDALRIAAGHARILLRAGRYEELGTLADSLLRANAAEEPTEAEPLMWLALLTGRIDRATNLVARVSGRTLRQVRGADGRPVSLPTTTLRERADFLVRASLGICDARVKAAPARLVGLLEASFPGGTPAGVESAFMERIVGFALPCLGPSVLTTLHEPGRSLPMWARAFDPADTGFAAEYAARERARPPEARGSESGVDGIILDASVKLALGDSAGALRALTLALDRIPIVNRAALSSEWSTGSTVRGMALAAEIAAGLGDGETARRWSSAIVALWRNADSELQPQVTRLRAIAKSTADAPSRE